MSGGPRGILLGGPDGDGDAGGDGGADNCGDNLDLVVGGRKHIIVRLIMDFFSD